MISRVRPSRLSFVAANAQNFVTISCVIQHRDLAVDVATGGASDDPCASLVQFGMMVRVMLSDILVVGKGWAQTACLRGHEFSASERDVSRGIIDVLEVTAR